MKFYEITDIKTGKTIEPAVTLQQATERRGGAGSAGAGAGYGKYAIGHRYAIEAVDTAIPKQDPIWIEWETRRNWFLKLCGRT